MSLPLVACICLTRDQPEFLARAVRCFRAQTYPRALRYLIVFDTGEHSAEFECKYDEVHAMVPRFCGEHIGMLRNRANGLIRNAKIVAHWDHDDWSHPDRLSQQVALLEATQRPVVGYYDMPFMDTLLNRVLWYDSKMRNYSLGTGLMYRREVWEQTPFPDQTPEDTTWQHQIGPDQIMAISSLRSGEPMMIQTLHSSNAAAKSTAAAFDTCAPGTDLERRVREILRTA